MDTSRPDQLPEFTARQSEVLLYTAAGFTRKDIALQLGIATTSVRTHQQALAVKLGGINIRHAVSRALMLGAITRLETLDTAARRKPGSRLTEQKGKQTAPESNGTRHF